MARINLRLGRFTINFNKGVSKLSDTRVQEVVGRGVQGKEVVGRGRRGVKGRRGGGESRKGGEPGEHDGVFTDIIAGK